MESDAPGASATGATAPGQAGRRPPSRSRGRLIDPYKLATLIGANNVIEFVSLESWHDRPISEAQEWTLRKSGVDPEPLSRGQAAVLIGHLVRRRKAGLATPKQVLQLQRLGHSRPGSASFAAAYDYIYQRSREGWRRG